MSQLSSTDCFPDPRLVYRAGVVTLYGLTLGERAKTTGQKPMSSDLTTTRVSLERILCNALDGIFVIDRERRYVMFNGACERITGYAASDVLGRECLCADLVQCQDDCGRSLSGALCPAQTLFDGTVDSARQRMQVIRKDGKATWIETVYTTVHDCDGRVEFVLGVVRDANEAKVKEGLLLEEMSKLHDQVRSLSEEQKRRYGFDSIVSKSPVMTPVFQKIRAALKNFSAVLVSGESGTGKEVIARTIHANGLNYDGPFIPLNCSALPRELIESELFGHVKGAFTGAVEDYEGLLRAAAGGTIFLDEISEMPLETQARLLRVLQDKRVRPVGSTREIPVQIRVIAATNIPPHEAVAHRKLRQDLFYRLSVIGIELPPLRERKADIPLLVQCFIEEFNQTNLRHVRDVDPAAWQALLTYSWPGNVRELSNAVESAFAMGEGPVLQQEDFPPEILGLRAPQVPGDAMAKLLLDPYLANVEREAIQRALQSANWQRNKAAELMGISRSRLYRRMEALGIDPNARS